MTPGTAIPEHFVIVKDAAAAAERTANLFVKYVNGAVDGRGNAVVCLAGGSTPREAYRLLAASPRANQVPWTRVEFFFGDERCVPPTDIDSNFRMANEALLSKVNIDTDHVHRIRGEAVPAVAASEYASALCGVLTSRALPRFDLVLLGMGTDGHTASLFPGSAAVDERERWVVATQRPDGHMGISLTLPVLNAARHVVLTATGDSKSVALRRVLANGPDPLPAARVRPGNGSLTWIVDEELASSVNSE